MRAALAGAALLLFPGLHTAHSGTRPYSADSPWNRPIGPNPKIHPKNADYIRGLTLNTPDPTLGSDPNQYTYPVYEVDASVSLRTVIGTGVFSNVTDDDTRSTVLNGGKTPWRLQIPIPEDAIQALGSDAQFIIWNTKTGDEWGFWQASKNADGTWSVRNGYHYNTNWDGVPATPFWSRGAGVPYLTGLIRPWEIAQGRIEHALAFAYQTPHDTEFVYPATKTDGRSTIPEAMPEGIRLQLNPALGEADFTRWGLSPAGKIIARCLQEYGMFLIDVSGHPKVMAEYEATAQWDGAIVARTVRNIPLSEFRVLVPTVPPVPDNTPPSPPVNLQAR